MFMDHLSAAPYIQSLLGGKLGIGEDVQHQVISLMFKAVNTYKIGSLEVTLFIPGNDASYWGCGFCWRRLMCWGDLYRRLT